MSEPKRTNSSGFDSNQDFHHVIQKFKNGAHEIEDEGQSSRLPNHVIDDDDLDEEANFYLKEEIEAANRLEMKMFRQ